LTTSLKRGALILWLVLVAGFAAAHFAHLRADFPNHSPWIEDWAKYTDEGWYGNAAVRAHLFGHWRVPGDFNPAPAVPVWPLLEWLLFFATGVKIEAARALAVSFFCLDLLLGYTLLRVRVPRWAALLAVTMAVTSPFLYAFSRLAILEPMLIFFLLAALNLAVRLPRFRRPIAASAAIGVLFTLMLLTKTTGVFLLPAIAWAILTSLWPDRGKAHRCAGAAALGFVVTFGAWMAFVVQQGVLRDYNYLFFVNHYLKPKHFYWPLISLWWAFHGGLWVDRVLIPAAGIAAVVFAFAGRALWRRGEWRDPVLGASVLAVAGYILFMTYQYHPQPRYYTVVALFAFFVLAVAVEGLVRAGGEWRRAAGLAALSACIVATFFNGIRMMEYVAHPEYTWVTAAQNVVRYIDEHPNGNRMLVSISGDEIDLIAHVPSLCDDFGTIDLPPKLAKYRPGWWATWNDIDPGTLEDLHIYYSLEQVATFRAFDHSERDALVLFKLHPLPGGQMRELRPELRDVMPGDKIYIDVE